MSPNGSAESFDATRSLPVVRPYCTLVRLEVAGATASTIGSRHLGDELQVHLPIHVAIEPDDAAAAIDGRAVAVDARDAFLEVLPMREAQVFPGTGWTGVAVVASRLAARDRPASVRSASIAVAPQICALGIAEIGAFGAATAGEDDLGASRCLIEQVSERENVVRLQMALVAVEGQMVLLRDVGSMRVEREIGELTRDVAGRGAATIELSAVAEGAVRSPSFLMAGVAARADLSAQIFAVAFAAVLLGHLEPEPMQRGIGPAFDMMSLRLDRNWLAIARRAVAYPVRDHRDLGVREQHAWRHAHPFAGSLSAGDLPLEKCKLSCG